MEATEPPHYCINCKTGYAPKGFIMCDVCASSVYNATGKTLQLVTHSIRILVRKIIQEWRD